MAAWLRARGVEEVEVEAQSMSTWDNARFSSAFLRERGHASAVVATCRWHLPRATENLRRFGIDALVPPLHLDQTPPASVKTLVREGLCRKIDRSWFACWAWFQ